MNIKVPASELNRIMKTISQCLGAKGTNVSNIEIVHDNNMFTIHSSNGIVSAIMSTPILGGDGEKFFVDGAMFARVCAMCNGDINIITDGKVCTIKGAGRTRIPIVNTKIPAFNYIMGNEFSITAESLSYAYNNVAFAISTDQSRLAFTGILFELSDAFIQMTTLDGFQMAVENIVGNSNDNLTVIIPGTFIKMLAGSAAPGDTIHFITDGKRIQAYTDDMQFTVSLLTGAFPDKNVIVPKEFKTETIVDATQLRNALKCGSVVNTKNNLVRMEIKEESLKIMSNSEEAEFDADVPCATSGPNLNIAFNQRYLLDVINSIHSNDIIMKFNAPVSPCVICGRDDSSYRLLLPVRTGA